MLGVVRDDDDVARDFAERREGARGIARRWGRWAMTNGMRLVVLKEEPYSSLLLLENGRVRSPERAKKEGREGPSWGAGEQQSRCGAEKGRGWVNGKGCKWWWGCFR